MFYIYVKGERTRKTRCGKFKRARDDFPMSKRGRNTEEKEKKKEAKKKKVENVGKYLKKEKFSP